ncbi:hypothetical protein [Roseomonas sp. HF4]|uniref:hypothetical protein n=1 Tax=Roseomonas sp. HF4 TaxID=2562313 RepID=UPI0010C03F0E|nr:hypothetical protein [Roseomonas sp. HF4]
MSPGRSPGACLAILDGIGGSLVLHHDRVRILRHGAWFSAINLLSHVEREIETTILLRRLAAVHLVGALGVLQFLRLSYAGAPPPTGHHLRDAFAENAFLFGLLDNRPLFAMATRIQAAARAGGPPGA